MTTPKQPKYSFLIDSLNVSPDDFFDRVKDENFKQNKYTGWSKFMEDTIKALTERTVKAQDLRNYNDEVVKSWGEYVLDKEWTIPGTEKKSIFNFIKNFSKECLRVQNGQVFFNIEKIDDWQSVSFHCGEDVFVAALLADMYHDSNYNPRDFQWDYILKSDFFLLNNLISQNKIVENHYHLGGSAPYVDLSWIFLMNAPFGQTARYDKFKDDTEESMYLAAHSFRETHQSDVENLVKTAAYLRLKLFEKCVLEKNCSFGPKTIKDIDKLLRGLGVLQADELQPAIETYRYQSPCIQFGIKVDYAIREFTTYPDEKNSYISGERYFNYRCLKYIYGNLKEDSFTQVLYYLYLLIRHRFNKEFIQSNNKTGFQNFKEYNERKSRLIDGTPYADMAKNIAIQGNIQENHLDQLEIRVAPNDKAEDLVKKINGTDSKAYFRSSRIPMPKRVLSTDTREFSDGTENYFYVLHFIKNREISWFSEYKDQIEIKDKNGGKRKYSVVRQCREFEKREEYRIQAETFKEMRDRNDEVCKRIFGIDAASNEVNFRPENFGTVFRFLSSSKIGQDVPWKRKIPDLRKTYHVGEDFYDIVDGLRAIDEAILFLELSQGDRIGHGVALGIDVEKWYERHPVISLPLQNKIDNIAWIRYKIREWGIDVPAYYCDKLDTEFNRLFLKLHEEKSPGVLAYIDAWKLRGDDPRCYIKEKPNKDNLKGFTTWGKYRIRDKKAYSEIVSRQESIDKEFNNGLRLNDRKHIEPIYELYHKYHFDEELKRRAIEREEFIFDKEYIDIVKQLQLRMRSYVTEKGIAVESCPTSNFLISNLDDYSEIPTFRLFPLRESHNDFRRLNVCVNTDDQGVFYTSLIKEYTLLMATMWKEQKDGVREHSDDKILNWIKHLMDYSKQLCFRTGDVRFYGVRNDNDLFNVPTERDILTDNRFVLPPTMP